MVDKIREVFRDLVDSVQISGGAGGGRSPYLSVSAQTRRLYPVEVVAIVAAVALVVGVLIGRR